MGKIISAIIGDMGEKKKYYANEKRAKALPKEYADAYQHIKQYIWSTAGILTIDPLVSLVDLLEEAAADGKHVIEVTGEDVAAFADDLVKGESSYKDKLRKTLNDKLGKSGE